MAATRQPPDRITVPQVQNVMGILLPLSVPWMIVIGLAILLSMFGITRTGDGTITVDFGLSAISVALVALIWLPVLLKAIVLTGIGVKTDYGELSTPGVLPLLAKMIAALDTVESQVPKSELPRVQAVAQDARQEAEIILAYSSSNVNQPREQLISYARDYELLRQSMLSGRERTFKMITIAVQARALARQVNFSSAEIRDLFESGSDGKRVIALSLLQALPYPNCFDLVLNAINGSRSAFEQYAALLAAERMLPDLSEEQKKQLSDALHDQRSGGPEKYITRDSDRWPMSERILAAIGGGSGGTAAP